MTQYTAMVDDDVGRWHRLSVSARSIASARNKVARWIAVSEWMSPEYRHRARELAACTHIVKK